MARTVAIGIQDFGKLMEHGYFYIDKTAFIKEWWESGDDVTLIMRPRRFGKTLNMSMLDYFFRLPMQAGTACLRACPSGGRKRIAECRVRIRLSAYLSRMLRRRIICRHL